MAQTSTIEWTDCTWNPVAGCSPVSPGCLNCYAARMALRLQSMPNAAGKKYSGTAKRARDGRPVFANRVNLDEEALETPRGWKLPRTIFVNSMSDLFHEQVPVGFIKRVFEVMNDCPQHRFQVLTKRPRRLVEVADKLEWTDNIWIGTSVETKAYYERIHLLGQIRRASVRFLSCEPLLGPLPNLPLRKNKIDWVIVGGESGPGARQMEAAWVYQIKERCESLGVPFFFKQWGGVQKKKTGRELDGKTWNGLPSAGVA